MAPHSSTPPMDGGAWWAAVHEVAKSRTQLSDFTFIYIYIYTHTHTHTHTHTQVQFFFFLKARTLNKASIYLVMSILVQSLFEVRKL